MTTASTIAERSRTEAVTAVQVEAAGGQWITHAWQFPDGSRGMFDVETPVLARAGEIFSHYGFVSAEGAA
jgi:hypothetical protein